MSTNPLRQPPFFPVANVNPDDPIRYGVSFFAFSLTVIALINAHLKLSTFYVYSVQIEQIEQLNTLLLQDIDHNFARFHDVVNNKILPQVKRYGIVSEPTRAASEVSYTQHSVSRHPLVDHDFAFAIAMFSSGRPSSTRQLSVRRHSNPDTQTMPRPLTHTEVPGIVMKSTNRH